MTTVVVRVFGAAALVLLGCLAAVVPDASGAAEPSARLLAEAQRAYYQDDFALALARARKAQALAPDDPRPLYLVGLVEVHRRQWDEVERLLGLLRRRSPGSAEGALLEGLLCGNTGKGGLARTALEEAVARHPGDRTLRLALASLLAATGEAHRAGAIVDECLAAGPMALPDELLGAAATLIVLPSRARQAEALLARCQELHGEGSELLMLRGLLRFRTGDYRRAVEELLAALRRNPDTLNEVVMLAPVLALLGQTAEVCRLLTKAVERFPHDAEAKVVRQRLWRRLSDERSLVASRHGSLDLMLPSGLDAGSLRAVIEQTEKAVASAESFFGFELGRVRLKVLGSLGVNAAAYYDYLNDEVVMAQGLISSAQAVAEPMVSVLRHEVGHLATRRLLERSGIPTQPPPLPIWFNEGLAECSAGRLRDDLRLLPFEPLSDEDLLLNLSIASSAKPSVRRAYAQAAVMVACLFGRVPQPTWRAAIGTFARSYGPSGELETSLAAAFGVDGATFRAEVRDRLLETAVPPAAGDGVQ